jgi:LmbE family N-acetylglucosaminyl deacetylase
MQTVLQVTPHPDDETLGAGGTLLRLRERDWQVATLACSFGRPADAVRRRRELSEACRRATFILCETEPIGIVKSWFVLLVA